MIGHVTLKNITCPMEQDGNLRWSRHTGETKTWFTGPRGSAGQVLHVHGDQSPS